MCGCSEQKYLKSPAVAKVNEKVPSVSIVFDLNLPADTTVWGMSSRLVQVTVSPTFTLISVGAEVILSIDTVTVSACASAPPSCRTTAAATAKPRPRKAVNSICNIPSALQRRVDDRERLVAHLEVDAGDAEHAAQLVVGDFHRAGRGRGARGRLREGGGARGVERDVALDLLHHLVDMAVQHRHRAVTLEILERARAVLGAPAPLRIHRPERDMGEHHDGGGFRAALEVVFEPFELLGAEIAEPAGLEIDHVDKPDEVHAAGVERIPAGALGALAVALLVELDLFIEEVVLARHIVHIELGLRDDAVGVVELGGLRQMRDVAGMDHEGRLLRHRVDLVDGFFQRAKRVRIGRLVEADMAVADLQEAHARGFGGVGGVDQSQRARYAA